MLKNKGAKLDRDYEVGYKDKLQENFHRISSKLQVKENSYQFQDLMKHNI